MTASWRIGRVWLLAAAALPCACTALLGIEPPIEDAGATLDAAAVDALIDQAALPEGGPTGVDGGSSSGTGGSSGSNSGPSSSGGPSEGGISSSGSGSGSSGGAPPVGTAIE